MQSHSDMDAFPFEGLQRKANSMMRDRLSEITAGKEGEPVLSEYLHDGMTVTHRPDDEHGLLRVSVGGGVAGHGEFDYCVFRGSAEACAALLDEAARAIRAG